MTKSDSEVNHSSKQTTNISANTLKVELKLDTAVVFKIIGLVAVLVSILLILLL